MIIPKSLVKPLLRVRIPTYSNRRNKPEPCKRFVKVTSCIFDLDGTILDNHAALDDVYKTVFKKFGHEYNAEWRENIMGMAGKELWLKLIKELKLKTEWKLMQDFFDETIKGKLVKAPVRPGVQKLIDHLAKRKIPMALVSSFGKETVIANTSHIPDIMQKFEVIIYGDDPQVKELKPARDIYLVTTIRFEGRPDGETCLVFENTPIGILAARAACMQVIGVVCPPTKAWSLRHADEVLNTLNEFRPGKYGIPPYEKLNTEMD